VIKGVSKAHFFAKKCALIIGLSVVIGLLPLPLAPNAHALGRKCDGSNGNYNVTFSDGTKFNVRIAPNPSGGSILTIEDTYSGAITTQFSDRAPSVFNELVDSPIEGQQRPSFCYDFEKCPSTSIIGRHDVLLCNNEGGGIWHMLNLAMQILTWGVGIIAVMGIVIAAIFYATAGGDQSKSRLAKVMIFNVAVGVVMYVLLYAIINFLIPGNISGSGQGNDQPQTSTN